ncbi:MAG: hypothetical protein QOE92_907, partial [Chloroflexota bacterium]|nr:hypothetical protein [Chloroflexota bacterium]
MERDPRRPFGGDEDDDPARPRTRGQNAKKPLDQFLAEFEARLRDAPDAPATDTAEELMARAQGTRRPARNAAAPATGPVAAPGAAAPEVATAEGTAPE